MERGCRWIGPPAACQWLRLRRRLAISVGCSRPDPHGLAHRLDRSRPDPHDLANTSGAAPRPPGVQLRWGHLRGRLGWSEPRPDRGWSARRQGGLRLGPVPRRGSDVVPRWATSRLPIASEPGPLPRCRHRLHGPAQRSGGPRRRRVPGRRLAHRLVARLETGGHVARPVSHDQDRRVRARRRASSDGRCATGDGVCWRRRPDLVARRGVAPDPARHPTLWICRLGAAYRWWPTPAPSCRRAAGRLVESAFARWGSCRVRHA